MTFNLDCHATAIGIAMVLDSNRMMKDFKSVIASTRFHVRAVQSSETHTS